MAAGDKLYPINLSVSILPTEETTLADGTTVTKAVHSLIDKGVSGQVEIRSGLTQSNHVQLFENVPVPGVRTSLADMIHAAYPGVWVPQAPFLVFIKSKTSETSLVMSYPNAATPFATISQGVPFILMQNLWPPVFVNSGFMGSGTVDIMLAGLV